MKLKQLKQVKITHFFYSEFELIHTVYFLIGLHYHMCTIIIIVHNEESCRKSQVSITWNVQEGIYDRNFMISKKFCSM